MKEKKLYNATICFLVKENKVLLAMKTRKIGAGCWNGYGGGIEAGETPEIAALRELEEECGVKASPLNLKKIAVCHFDNTTAEGENFTCTVHVYTVDEWTGVPKETDAMITPTWFDVDALPESEMMPADRLWVKRALQGEKILVHASYGPHQKTLLGEVKIEPLVE